MKTLHRVLFHDAAQMIAVPSDSVDLVITSPPYPMIKIWDESFVKQDPHIGDALAASLGPAAFELMHKCLDAVWNEAYRVLAKGGLACINIGDATRSIDGNFSLYQNHTRVMSHLLALGLNALPGILWRKQTNAPNKFMGSGMLPPTAYVTLEHEHILIARKGEKREFGSARERRKRHESAFFWEERNVWFSDIWEDLKGTPQRLFDDGARDRSAAFPFDLPYRLINMFSVKGDTVLDPFLGIGTTMYAAMAAGRHSIGFEIDSSLKDYVFCRTDTIVDYANSCIDRRLRRHVKFVDNRLKSNKGLTYVNQHYGFPVMTKQETKLFFNPLLANKEIGKGCFETTYSTTPDRHTTKIEANQSTSNR